MSLFSIVICPQSLCFNEVAICLEVRILLLQGWPTSQRRRATFITVLQQRATSYTWAHMNITPSVPHSHTHFCLARFIVNITQRQHDNKRTLKGIYCYACYLVGLLVLHCVSATWNWAKSRMWCGSRATGWPPSAIVFSVSANSKKWQNHVWVWWCLSDF